MGDDQWAIKLYALVCTAVWGRAMTAEEKDINMEPVRVKASSRPFAPSVENYQPKHLSVPKTSRQHLIGWIWTGHEGRDGTEGNCTDAWENQIPPDFTATSIS